MTTLPPSSMLSSALRGATLLAAALLPAAALAHTTGDGGAHHGFTSGLLHPLTGLDHLAAMLAVGLWSALTAVQARAGDYLRAPLAFAALLLAGALLGAAGLPFPGVEPMIVASLLVLGLLLAGQRRLPAATGMALVGGFALFHGAAHGAELGSGAALAGMVLATALLHGAGLAAGHLLRRRSPWWPRVAGGATVALGAALLLA
jgi:urease accessory protein